ncbi:hypothetical protein, partial [Vibrio vulnificus]|uniref:hypothetical protein n=1 Tax=Vibrio vulnificus TaxID=672 RepID=UPI0039B444C4
KAVAAAFIGQDVNAKAEAAALLRNVTSSTRELIAEVAQGRVVLVKQGVVGGVYTDITDEVMESAGLPTENLPTVDLITQIAETEPTKLSAS